VGQRSGSNKYHCIVYFTSRGIYNGIKKIVDNKKMLITVDAAKSDLTKLSQQGYNPSFPDTQYKLWADKIQAAFDGCDPSLNVGGYVLSSSGQALFDICTQLKNDSDFLNW
jgi:hypothetical protein